jgi:hypothetical protein
LRKYCALAAGFWLKYNSKASIVPQRERAALPGVSWGGKVFCAEIFSASKLNKREATSGRVKFLKAVKFLVRKSVSVQ